MLETIPYMEHMGMWANVGKYSINGGDMGKTHRKNAGLTKNIGLSWEIKLNYDSYIYKLTNIIPISLW